MWENLHGKQFSYILEQLWYPVIASLIIKNVCTLNFKVAG